MEAEVAKRNSLWLIPAFFLFAYALPYLILLTRFSAAPAPDSYVFWVLLYSLAQAAASAALSLAVGLLLTPAFLKTPWVKPIVVIPFFAPALSTVDALVRLHGDVMYGPLGIVIAHTAYYAPYVALLAESNLRSVPADLLDALEIYAMRRLTKLRVVIWELKPSLLYAFYTVFVFSYLSFTTPLLLGGRYPTLELLAYVYATSFASTQLLSTVVVLVLLTSLLLAIPLLKLPAPPSSAPSPRPPRIGWLAASASLAAVAYYAVLVVHILQPLTAPRGLSELAPHLLNSFVVGVVSSAVSIAAVLAFLAADLAGSRASILVYVVSMAMSKSLFAIGYFYLAQPLYGTLLALAVAHALVITPLTYSLLKPAFEKIRLDVREACTLYLTPVKCVARVITEALGPSVVQAWLLSLASSLSETTLAFILTAGGATTLSAHVAKLLTSRAPDFIETGHFYSAVLAAVVILVMAASRLVKTRPYSF
ncbi:MAG: iron ABC transporter permease [Pyrobaculum sp.]